MRQRTAWLGVVAVAVVAGLAAQGSNGRAAEADRKREAATRKAESRTAALVKKLNEKITLERKGGIKSIDFGTPLKDALEFFSDRFGVQFFIDEEAFKEGAKEDAQIDVAGARVQFSNFANIALRDVFRLLLAQVPRDWAGGATYVVRDGYIEITSKNRAAPERLRAQKVAAVFDKRPLDEALQELSDLSGVSVVLDNRLGESAKTAVTATFKNDIALETAVRLLADMADAKAVVMDGGLYVTTKANAALFAPEKSRSGQPRRRGRSGRSK
jgi:hypothetical protein